MDKQTDNRLRYRRARVRSVPITRDLGTEVFDAQLRDLGERALQDVRELVAERGVLVFRDQTLDLDEQIALGRRLGPIHVHPLHDAGVQPEALRIHTDETSTFANGDTWHSDLSWNEAPPALSILRFETLPEVGGDTAFASGYGALDALSAHFRALLDDLTAVHVYRNVSDRPAPEASHPVIRTHPVSRRPALFVNRGYTETINELADGESDAVLAYLFAHISNGAPFQCRVRWYGGTVVLWDNRCTQHYACWDYFPAVRSGWRVTITGERPFRDRSLEASR